MSQTRFDYQIEGLKATMLFSYLDVCRVWNRVMDASHAQLNGILAAIFKNGRHFSMTLIYVSKLAISPQWLNINTWCHIHMIQYKILHLLVCIVFSIVNCFFIYEHKCCEKVTFFLSHFFTHNHHIYQSWLISGYLCMTWLLNINISDIES